MEFFMIENFIKKLTKWFDKDKKIVFFTTFIIGMFVHFQLYTNELLAYDAYWHYGSFLAKGWEISLGRFLIPFIDLLKGTVVSSFLTSVISIFIMAFTTLILTDLLKVKKTYIKILMGILLVVTPTFSLTLMYPYTGDSYTYAMLFSVLSVYFLNKEKNYKNIIFSIICTILTLGFYQAYLCVIITLCAITYLINMYSKENLTFKNFVRKICYDICIIISGIIIYYIAYVLLVKILNLSITSYNGGNKILSIDTLKNLLFAVKNTYTTFFEFNFKNTIIENTEFVYRNFVNAFMFFLIIFNFIFLIVNKKTYKTPYKMIFTIILLLMFPIFTCVIELIAQERKIDLLMASALYLPIILLLKQIELVELKPTKYISVFIVLLTLWTFILCDNATYIATNLYNKQMSALGNRVIERIENTKEITQDTPICIIGKMNFNIQNPRLLKLTNFDVSNVNIWTWQIFLQDNLALGRNICTFESYENIFNNEQYLSMHAFPSEDCIKIIDGIAVVKIGY